jgi:hypothetical protein
MEPLIPLGGQAGTRRLRWCGRALRKVSTSGRRIAGARWQPECQARHPEDDGGCSGDRQAPGAGRCCRIADAAGSCGICRLEPPGNLRLPRGRDGSQGACRLVFAL